MKHFLLLALVIFFVSCGNQKFKKDSGSMYVMVYAGPDSIPRGPFLAKYSTQGVVDSNGKTVQDTSWSIRDGIDSARDTKGKVVYDSVKKIWPKAEHWLELTEISNPPKWMVQVCPIPKSRLSFTLTKIPDSAHKK